LRHFLSSAHRTCCLFSTLDVLIYRSFTSTDAVPVNGFAHQHQSTAGPSSVGARATRDFGDDDGAPPVAENQFHHELRCVADRRGIFAFEADAVSLRRRAPCGMMPILLGDVADCFRWLVDYLFSGACARRSDTTNRCTELYEKSVCADVASGMQDPLGSSS
jgi:hypothetical protein